jgi:hypothetical protein
MNQPNKAFAEVVQSSLHSFTAQSWNWDQFPAYGSLCTIEQANMHYIGLVYDVTTGSMDSSRYPFPFKKTEQELKAEQPQIFEFLRTTFSCLTLGYVYKGVIRYSAPPQPAKMHAFVQPIERELQQRFYASDQYLHRLFGLSNQIMNLDDLLIAQLHERQMGSTLSKESMQKFLHTYSLLTGNDYRRMKLFLQRAPHEFGI